MLKTIGSFTRAFESADAEAMAAAWDDRHIGSDDETGLVYQAEERLSPLFTIDEIKQYATDIPNVLSRLEDVCLLDKKVWSAGDFAYAYIRFWCRAVMSSGTAVDGQIRQTLILRKQEEQWRIVHYHESRQSPGFE